MSATLTDAIGCEGLPADRNNGGRSPFMIMFAYFMLRRTVVRSLFLSFLFHEETSVLESLGQITALCGLIGLSCREGHLSRKSILTERPRRQDTL